MKLSEDNMSHTNCVLCLEKSAQILPKYLQFSSELFVSSFNKLCLKINRQKSGDDKTFSFCRHCRVYLIKLAKLNDQLESLAGDFCQVNEKQKDKFRKISFIQGQIRENYYDSKSRLGSRNRQEKDEQNHEQGSPATPECLQRNGSEISQIQIVETTEAVELIEVSDDDVNDASNFNGSQANVQPLSRNTDKKVQVDNSAQKMGGNNVDKFEGHPAWKSMSIQEFPKSIKQVSEKDFIYKGKLPIEQTHLGFKCGTCAFTTKFSQPPWKSIITHMTTWHSDSGRVRKLKVLQRFVEIAPDRFQYGNYAFEKSNDKWRCLTCDHLVTIGRGEYKFKYISFHLNTKHENPEKPMCEVCGVQLNSPDALRRHKSTQHNESSASYPCSSCEKTFKTQIQVRQHEKSAHSDRYFQCICEICGEKFKDKTRLQGHVAFSHHGERTFQCNECGKAYATQGGLFVHQNSRHTGKHKYTCDICGMNFAQSYSITRHKMTAHKK